MNRKSAPASFYFDAKLIGNYFGCFLPEEPQKYHHTGPISMYFAMHAALALIAKEGLDKCIHRHHENWKLLRDGLSEMGLEFFVVDEVIINH